MNESLAEPYRDELEIGRGIVTVDHEGKRIERSLILREDMKKLSSNQGEATGIAGTSKGDEPKLLHSEKITRMLTAHPPARCQEYRAEQGGYRTREKTSILARAHRSGKAGWQDAVRVAIGTAAARPSGVAGLLRDDLDQYRFQSGKCLLG